MRGCGLKGARRQAVVASAGKDTLVKLWDVRAGAPAVATLHGHKATVMQARARPVHERARRRSVQTLNAWHVTALAAVYAEKHPYENQSAGLALPTRPALSCMPRRRRTGTRTATGC